MQVFPSASRQLVLLVPNFPSFRSAEPGDLSRPLVEFNDNEGLTLGRLLANAVTSINSSQESAAHSTTNRLGGLPSDLATVAEEDDGEEAPSKNATVAPSSSSSSSPSSSAPATTAITTNRKHLRRVSTLAALSTSTTSLVRRASNAIVEFRPSGDEEQRRPASRMLQAISENNNDELTAIFEVKHPWLCDLLAAALSDEMHLPATCDVQLAVLNAGGVDREGGRSRDLAIGIGESLPYFLSATSAVAPAVGNWIQHYPSLVELSVQLPWFGALVEGLISKSDADANGFVARFIDLQRQALDLLAVAEEDKSGDLKLLLRQLGRRGNRRRTLLSLVVPYIVNAAMVAIPLNKAFSGFGANPMWTWLVFPLVVISVALAAAGGAAVVSKSYAVYASLPSPQLAFRLRTKLLVFGSVLAPALFNYPFTLCLMRFLTFPFPW